MFPPQRGLYGNATQIADSRNEAKKMFRIAVGFSTTSRKTPNCCANECPTLFLNFYMPQVFLLVCFSWSNSPMIHLDVASQLSFARNGLDLTVNDFGDKLGPQGALGDRRIAVIGIPRPHRG